MSWQGCGVIDSKATTPLSWILTFCQGSAAINLMLSVAAACLFALVHSLSHPFVYFGSFKKALFVVLGTVK